MSLPFSQACENNKAYIFDIIQHQYPTGGQVLEIGSGTTQHIKYFAELLPNLRWLPSEVSDYLPTVLAGLADCALPNIGTPQALDAGAEHWPVMQVEGIFTANTLHIMRIEYVESFFRGSARALKEGGKLCVYGPFKYQGEFTTPSNAAFDDRLKQRDQLSGLRDFEQMVTWAQLYGLQLLADHSLPANNQLLVWQKITDLNPS